MSKLVGKGNNNTAQLIIVTRIFARYKFLHYYELLLLALFSSSFLSLIIRLEPIFVRSKRIFAVSVRRIVRNFADDEQ